MLYELLRSKFEVHEEYDDIFVNRTIMFGACDLGDEVCIMAVWISWLVTAARVEVAVAVLVGSAEYMSLGASSRQERGTTQHSKHYTYLHACMSFEFPHTPNSALMHTRRRHAHGHQA